MDIEFFSKKYNTRPIPNDFFMDSIPDTTRTGLINIIEQYFYPLNNPTFYSLYQRTCLLLRKEVDLRYKGNHIRIFTLITEQIKQCKWDYFYEICQIAYTLIKNDNSSLASAFSRDIATLFEEEGLGWEFNEGAISRRRPEILQVSISKARVLISNPEFRSADELFEKAIHSLNERPEPDSENCIKDAIASVESVGKIIVKDKNAHIDKIIKGAIQKDIIPKLLGDPIIKLYAYRGDEPSIAHGGISPSKVSLHEAEFILAISAAIIIYLVSKRSELETI